MNEGNTLPARQQWTRKFPVVGESTAGTGLTQANWRLNVVVDGQSRAVLDFNDLLALPQTTMTRDIHCVTRWSRQGDRFTGVLLRDLVNGLALSLAEGFVRFVAYSERGHDTSLPLAVCLNEEVMLVHQFNGEPLAPEHGFPVRTFAPSRYFYKSLKWLKEIHFQAEDQLGYWERGGYHNEADFIQEQRYVSGNLTPAALVKLRRDLNFNRYQGQVLLSLDLSGLNLAGADLRNVQLKNCNMQNCNLRGADLRGANLSNTNLVGSDLQSANLTQVDLDGALLMACDLTAAKLDKTWLNATEFVRDGFAPAVVTGASFLTANTNGLVERQQQFLKSQGVTL